MAALNRWLTDEEYARALSNGIKRKTLNYRIYEAEWDLLQHIYDKSNH